MRTSLAAHGDPRGPLDQRRHRCSNPLRGPIALRGLGIAAAQPTAMGAALVSLAHIAFDRMLGYGLRGRAFGDTHLGMLGRRTA